MNQGEFRQQIAKASELVKTWPNWKQNILVYSSRPTVSTPRPPVKGQNAADEKQEEAN